MISTTYFGKESASALSRPSLTSISAPERDGRGALRRDHIRRLPVPPGPPEDPDLVATITSVMVSLPCSRLSMSLRARSSANDRANLFLPIKLVSAVHLGRIGIPVRAAISIARFGRGKGDTRRRREPRCIGFGEVAPQFSRVCPFPRSPPAVEPHRGPRDVVEARLVTIAKEDRAHCPP
jgi:hypothetical protein